MRSAACGDKTRAGRHIKKSSLVPRAIGKPEAKRQSDPSGGGKVTHKLLTRTTAQGHEDRLLHALLLLDLTSDADLDCVHKHRPSHPDFAFAVQVAVASLNVFSTWRSTDCFPRTDLQPSRLASTVRVQDFPWSRSCPVPSFNAGSFCLTFDDPVHSPVVPTRSPRLADGPEAPSLEHHPLPPAQVSLCLDAKSGLTMHVGRLDCLVAAPGPVLAQSAPGLHSPPLHRLICPSSRCRVSGLQTDQLCQIWDLILCFLLNSPWMHNRVDPMRIGGLALLAVRLKQNFPVRTRPCCIPSTRFGSRTTSVAAGVFAKTNRCPTATSKEHSSTPRLLGSGSPLSSRSGSSFCWRACSGDEGNHLHAEASSRARSRRCIQRPRSMRRSCCSVSTRSWMPQSVVPRLCSLAFAAALYTPRKHRYEPANGFALHRLDKTWSNLDWHSCRRDPSVLCQR
ncbi:hypothetical protein IWX50DRAFT_421754 [Phyllosticta citricarpa]